MKKLLLLFVLYVFILTNSFAAPTNKFHLLIAPATVTGNSVTLLWDKQYANNAVVYELLLNGKHAAFTSKTNYSITNLLPNTSYTASVRLKGDQQSIKQLFVLKFVTKAKSKIFNILDYGAKDDTTFINTKAIQSAINACTEGGTVYIPKGIFISGAIFLKSNMTLYIEKGAELKGSTATDDYLPMIYNRFEGWEMNTYASLINAGTLNRNGEYNVKSLRITGGGAITGGGKKLGDAMIKANGMRSRGRLICLMNCQDVCISNLTISEPPSWTIHYIYSNNITCHDLTIKTFGIRNGDGLDPDSSTDSYIFNCTFDTGDDCIAIKSGKNPEGYFVAKPTNNVRITDCDFIRGHGISIGSEMSGGVSNVLVQDCKAGALLHGMQIKGTKDRGGYVRNVIVSDCQLLQITIFSAVNYNNDGEAAPEIPTFENFVFRNIDLTAAQISEPVININGFKDPGHYLRNVVFTNIKLPAKAKVVMNDAEKITLTGVKCTDGQQPEFVLTNCSNILH